MKKIFNLLVFVTIFSIAANAQSDYKSAIGLRFGGGYYDLVSVSYKTFISDPGAIELSVGFRGYGVPGYNWFNVAAAGAYQHHFDIKPVAGLKWFIGGGAIVSNSFSSYDAYTGIGFGIFPTAGADYKFSNIPLNLSVDVRPTFNIIDPYAGYNRFYGNGAVAARYTF